MNLSSLPNRVLGGILSIAAHLPWGVLYILSDIIYTLAYHILRYRRRCVAENIDRCFPDASQEWRRRTVREFYRRFADYTVETLKLPNVSDDEMRRRVEYVNVEMVDLILKSGRSIVAYSSHCFNWEWAPAITLHTSLRPDTDAEFCQVYRPLKNKWFDLWFLNLRSRFGSHSFAKSHVLRDLIMLKRRNMPSMTGFMSDQKPSHGDPTLPVIFLGTPTTMITGTETLARKLDMAVVYMDMERISRGHYRVTLRHICDHPSDMPPMEITRAYASLLEATIRRDPPCWLWTHKRWKIPVSMEDVIQALKTYPPTDRNE